ncbi:MAG: extensin family protein [Xanthobacteraceae bacterium]
MPVAPSRALPAAKVAVTPAATLACPVVSALDRWVTETIQPAAQRWFGQQVVEMKQISAYSCRGMNGNPRARISEHAFGNALDIAGFVLSDGHVVTVRNGWRGTAEEQGFLRDVQNGACQMFATVLAPGSNRFHYDHIHVDLMRRNSGRNVCQPEAIPGEVVAARVRGRSKYAGRRPSSYDSTGALGSRRKKQASARLPDARFKDDRNVPAAIPGED